VIAQGAHSAVLRENEHWGRRELDLCKQAKAEARGAADVPDV
jgi:hypothetical protein